MTQAPPIRGYEPRGACLDLMYSRAPEELVEGPAGTGKSRAVLQRDHAICKKYPGTRILWARKRRVHLNESILNTFETIVLGERSPLLTGAQRSHREKYVYPNGSEIVLGGMDNPHKFRSAEFALIREFEASEFTLDDHEMLVHRLRQPDPPPLPWTQITAETNPDQPTHWLNLRPNEKREDGTPKMRRFLTRHQDNPLFWDAAAGDWTAEGRRYVLGDLANLSGVRRERYYLGRWVAAEGQIWDEWDAATHIIDKLPPGMEGRCSFVAGVDWGFKNPGWIGIFAVDYDGRMYLVRQVYRAGQTRDWWIGQASALNLEFRPDAFACDSADPEMIKQMQTAGLPAREAHKSVEAGIDCVRERIIKANDGRPRLYVLADSLQDRDPDLSRARKPCCLEEEIPGYVYPKGVDGKPIKEKPDPACPNHACDGTRYAAMYLARYHERAVIDKPMFPAGSYGDVLGHEEVLDELEA